MNSYVLTVTDCERYDEKGLLFWHCDINKVLDFVVIEDQMAVVTEGFNRAYVLQGDDFLLSGDTCFSLSDYTVERIYNCTRHFVDCAVVPQMSVKTGSFIAVFAVKKTKSLHITDKAYLKHLLFDVKAEGSQLFHIYDKRSHELGDLRPKALQEREVVQ